MALEFSPSRDMERIRERIREKQRNYASYNFSSAQNDLLRAFFDLAQEFESNEDFYLVCVAALSEFLGLNSRLYLLDQNLGKLMLVCDSEDGLLETPEEAPGSIRFSGRVLAGTSSSYLVPIYRKPVQGQEGAADQSHNLFLLGVLEVYPLKRLLAPDRFFLRKYANRIGYNLHNRVISHENIRHLKFINNLVMDIEHNVVTPNMYFKHLLHQLKARIDAGKGLEQLIAGLEGTEKIPAASLEQARGMITSLCQDLLEAHRQLRDHHANFSLFLESLFRRDHFAKGHFVLRSRSCAIDQEIVAPQLDHHLSRFKARGITLERPADMQGEELFLRVDVGLLSQVYANLFSNAVKYTQAIVGHRGELRKAVAYGREIVPDYFGPGKTGVKFNVFTTGEHLGENEKKEVFADGVRGEASKGLPGTGHGLAFVKQVVEMHGGVAGYEATAEGNNFYFVLPLSAPEETVD